MRHAVLQNVFGAQRAVQVELGIHLRAQLADAPVAHAPPGRKPWQTAFARDPSAPFSARLGEYDVDAALGKSTRRLKTRRAATDDERRLRRR